MKMTSLEKMEHNHPYREKRVAGKNLIYECGEGWSTI